MDLTQLSALQGAQALLKQHLDALEKACGLGREVERALASLGAPSGQRATFAFQLPPLQGALLPPSGAKAGKHQEARVTFQEGPNEGHHEEGVTFQEGAHAVRESSSPISKPHLGRQHLAEPLLAHGASSSSIGGSSSADTSWSGHHSQKHKKKNKQPLNRQHSFSVYHEVEHGRSQELLRSISQKKKPLAVHEEDLYRTEGIAVRILRSEAFHFSQFVMILANCLWVGVDTSVCFSELAEQSLICVVPNNAFCTFFFLEIVMRLLAFKRRRDVFMVWWFLFDAILVWTMVWQEWVVPMLHLAGIPTFLDNVNVSFLRVLRLTRIARIARMSKSVPMVMFYASGVLEGMRATVPLLSLLSVFVYIFAVTFTVLLSETETSFASVPQSFHFLFLSAFAGFDKNFINTMLDHGWLPWLLFWIYMIVGNLTVGKMLTGVLLQVVQRIVQKGKQQSDTEELEIAIHEVVQQLDSDQDGGLSREEFERLVDHNALLDIFHDHDVDVAGFIDFTRSAFPAHGDLFVTDIVRLAKEFCGFRPASGKDIVNMRKLMARQFKPIRQALDDLRESAQTQMEDCGGQGGILSPLPRVNLSPPPSRGTSST
jgi:hypothetical protein